MHSYLRSVGFSNIKKREDLEQILGMVMAQPTEKYVTSERKNYVEAELVKDFSDRLGVAVRGEYDEKGFFHLEHYYPYFKGKITSIREEVAINKRVDTDAYTGMCDDLRIGVSLIFYLQNVIDYIDCIEKNRWNGRAVPIMLTGLASEGKILLGTSKDSNTERNIISDNKQRTQLLAEAKKGNQEAIDSLTIDDIDLYAMVSRRIRYEDIYSIVESTFIPYGSESDNYTVIANIVEVKKLQNEFTNEYIYDLVVECNDIMLEVCINEKDLVGTPEPGRRFKGNIWLQGTITFVEQ
ncbi:protein of unknown function [Anaerosporobacter mobilis DSM 15930]|uniref:Uncharacterized protein n=1 Tax=Anaerosporobacter mobilis DSM 15930 TaxID=1120996 RepID=A0A1M7ITW1_9FIRM|nr:DUF3881 family protein [Anaerosporobacter mobilis]SHM44254.1 protein of unknown function [Anaerosporobacter mobilis DSM 15930]